MSNTEFPQPNFENPPVTEVVLDVQFGPLPSLSTLKFTELSQPFRDRYPTVEEHAPLARRELMSESDLPSIKVVQEGSELPPMRRQWFIQPSGNELLQLQEDRFTVNWRKLESSEYPRYARLRASFRREFEVLRRSVEDLELGSIVPNFCEILYVNHIHAGTAWERHGQIGNVFRFWASPILPDWIAEPTTAQFIVNYKIPPGDGISRGMFSMRVSPAVRESDRLPVLAAHFSVSGVPEEASVDGLSKFFDTGHKWIVNGFAVTTTPEMHQHWRRVNDD